MIEKTSEYNSKTSNLIQMFSINNNVLNSENFSNLSGGERKKISLIGGLIQDSSVIILDEPTNSLDKDSVKQLSKILLDIGKTVIIITHNNSLIKLCDKIFDIDLKNSSERNLGELI
jgi:ATPase subunit of ABC transporter with duplicated ATPase domains